MQDNQLKKETDIASNSLLSEVNTSTIELSNSSLKVSVDSDMHQYLSQWKWKLVRGYAKRSALLNGKKTTVSMHREIINPKLKDKVIFKDKNKLNCKKINLCIGTQSDVRKYSLVRTQNISGFKGVRKVKSGYVAEIKINGISKYLGTYKTSIEAAAAYNNEASKLYLEFAQLNDI